MSHVIRLRLFQTLNSCRWNFDASGLLLRVDGIELRATFPGVVTAVTPRSLWRPSCRCGLVCRCVCWPRIQLVLGTKFAMRGLLAAAAVQSSPCSGKTCQIEPFWASRASFIPGVGPCDSCWVSFIPKWPGVILVEDFVSLWRSLCVQLSASRRTRAPQPGPTARPPPSTPPAPGVQARSVGTPRPHRWSLRPERSGLRPRDLALHSGMVSAKIVVSTPTWRVIRPPVR